MEANPTLGVLLHAIGGLAAGSFYIPYKQVKRWAWESYWLVGGFFSWILAPWLAVLMTCPDVLGVLRATPLKNVFWVYVFGVIWGVGGLTFGLSMRYLGMSLGYAMALGFCAAFGTIMPPVFNHQLVDLASKLSGQVTLGGVAVCLLGIAICGLAGMRKEKELSATEKTATIKEFNFVKGLWVAVFAGVMSACMAFAIAAGKPISELAVAHGTPDVFKVFPIYTIALAGGFTTNLIWCGMLNLRNGSVKDYFSGGEGFWANYLFSAAAGVTWYLQFFFYGMGTTQMGKYDFSSWTIHMAFIIVFSNLWGLHFHEWKGASRRTLHVVFAGILVLVASTVVVGMGNYLAAQK